MICYNCSHKCDLFGGRTGRCHARSEKDGAIVCDNYGAVTSLALDPIEKKPLARFFPGSMILSVGSLGESDEVQAELFEDVVEEIEVSLDGDAVAKDGCIPSDADPVSDEAEEGTAQDDAPEAAFLAAEEEKFLAPARFSRRD